MCAGAAASTMLAVAVLCTLGVTVLAFAVTAIQHAGSPGKYGPAGGLAHYETRLIAPADG
jgi:hypothetical protein